MNALFYSRIHLNLPEEGTEKQALKTCICTLQLLTQSGTQFSQAAHAEWVRVEMCIILILPTQLLQTRLPRASSEQAGWTVQCLPLTCSPAYSVMLPAARRCPQLVVFQGEKVGGEPDACFATGADSRGL